MRKVCGLIRHINGEIIRANSQKIKKEVCSKKLERLYQLTFKLGDDLEVSQLRIRKCMYGIHKI